MFQRDHPALAAAAVGSEGEVAGGAEIIGEHPGMGAQLRLVVAVPAHAVVTVAVEVGQGPVGGAAGEFGDPPPQRVERRRPAPALMGQPRIPIRDTLVRHPAGQPGHRMLPAEHPHPGPVPGQLVTKRVKESGRRVTENARNQPQARLMPQVDGRGALVQPCYRGVDSHHALLYLSRVDT